MGNQSPHAQLLRQGVELSRRKSGRLVVHWGRGINTFLDLRGVPAGLLIPYASVNGKILFKFRFDVFSVGSQNFNVMCQKSRFRV